MSQHNRSNFGSKLGVILATAGSAVGLGNVWRFPYLAGENGGAAFILLYILCVLLLGIPCMICEFAVGRHSHTNAARAFQKMSNGTPWGLIGYVGVLTGVLITGYYAVVAGWCGHYVFASAIGHLDGNPEYFKQYFNDISGDAVIPVFWAILMIVITHFVVVRGVQSGIEKASKMMMPMLFVLLLVVVVCSCMLPGASKGIEYVFNPDFSKISADSIIDALGQTFFSMSIGMGCLCTYASYFKEDTNLTSAAVQISGISILVAVLAALMIFPAAFAVGIEPDAGPSLIFITLPNVFEQAFGGIPFLAEIVSIAFYLMLVLAALTSLISLHEVGTAYLHEEKNISRRKAAWIVTGVCSLICIFCSLSFGDREWLHFFGGTLFSWFDFVTGQLMLPIGGLFTTLFVCWYVDKKIIYDQYTNRGHLSSGTFPLFFFCAKFFCPVCIILIFLNGLGLL